MDFYADYKKAMRRLFFILIILMFTMILNAQPKHTVVEGDTLFAIAMKFDVSVDALMEANGIADPSELSIGVSLNIPSTHAVVTGDTYFGIAQKYKITVDELLELNERSSDDILLVGETLVVPGFAAGITIDPPAIVEATPEEEQVDFYWPHSGTRFPFHGSLEGEAFTGEEGDKIYSVCHGQVISVGPQRGFNTTILVKRQDNMVFGYAGNRAALVKIGDVVSPGTELALLGANSRYDSPTAFFFVWDGQKSLDPSKVDRY